MEYFSINIISKKINNEINWNQKDIFERIKEITLIKLKIFEKYSYLVDFSFKLFKDKSMEEIKKSYSEFSITLYSQIYNYNIDCSLFKENIDIQKAINIIKWTLERQTEEYRERIKNDFEKLNLKFIEKEFYEYIDLLKLSFYK